MSLPASFSGTQSFREWHQNWVTAFIIKSGGAQSQSSAMIWLSELTWQAVTMPGSNTCAQLCA